MEQGPLRILIDGKCSVCARESRALMRLDRGRGRIEIVDISDAEFDPDRFGVTMAAVVGAIHAVEPDGTVTTGMEVFRRAYSAIGLGWVMRWTAWWPFRPVVDRFYAWFARNRTRIFGGTRCDDDRCGITPVPTGPAGVAGRGSSN